MPTSPSDAYELATHTVKVRRTGAMYDVMPLWDLTGVVVYSFFVDDHPMQLYSRFAVCCNIAFVCCFDFTVVCVRESGLVAP